MGQATAQRAAIAYLLITNISERLGKQRTMFSDNRTIQQMGLPRRNPILRRPCRVSCSHPVDEIDINDMGGLS